MVRVVTFTSLLAALVVGVYLFGAGSRAAGPTSHVASRAQSEGAVAAATANFQQAAAALEQNRAVTGSYAGANLAGFGVTLVRADATSYCLQAGSGPGSMHVAGPNGAPAAGTC